MQIRFVRAAQAIATRLALEFTMRVSQRAILHRELNLLLRQR
jgi:hypothetical protein